MRKFFAKTASRRLFGTRLLEMNHSTILRMCKSNKFHFSSLHNLKISEDLDNTTTIITTNKVNTALETSSLSEIGDSKKVVDLLDVINKSMINLDISKLMSSLRIQSALNTPSETLCKIDKKIQN